MIDQSQSPADICKLIDGVTINNGVAVREWLRDRQVEVGNGKSVFQAIADSVRANKIRVTVERTVAEIGAARLLRSPADFAEFLEEKAREIRSAST